MPTKKNFAILFAACFVLSLTSSLAAYVQVDTMHAGASQKPVLSIEVTDMSKKGGQIIIALFDKPSGFPKELKRAVKLVKVDPKKPTYKFSKLPLGKYAIVVIHDLNKNGKVDKNFVGFPTEPIGLANYKSISIGNPPNFRKATVTFQKTKTVKIKLQKI